MNEKLSNQSPNTQNVYPKATRQNSLKIPTNWRAAYSSTNIQLQKIVLILRILKGIIISASAISQMLVLSEKAYIHHQLLHWDLYSTLTCTPQTFPRIGICSYWFNTLPTDKQVRQCSTLCSYSSLFLIPGGKSTVLLD